MIYYLCANNINIGDYFSMLGVKHSVGLPGNEIFLEKSSISLPERLKLFKKTDVLIIGGGGILKDYFEKFWIEILKFQKKIGYKIYIFGIGVCDHKDVSKSTIMNRDIIFEILNVSKINYIRSPINFLKSDKIEETFCPSMYYVYDKYLKLAGSEKNQLLYVSHESLVGKNKDLEIINNLQEYCKKNNLLYTQINNIAKNQNAIDFMMENYLSSKIIVTTRLHGYIIAKSLGKKVLAISKDNKIDGFAKSIEDPIPLNLNELSYEILSKSINSLKITNQLKIKNIINNIKQNGININKSITGG